MSTIRPARFASRSSFTSKQTRAAWLFLVPFLVAFVAMLVVPLFYSGYLSLFQKRIIGGEVFVGLDNYLEAFSDPAFWEAIGRMTIFLVVQVPIMLGLALFFALALDSRRVRGSGFTRLAIFVPYAVPGVIATLMWGYFLGNDFGPIAQGLRALGLPAPDMLAPGWNILGSMMNIVSWEYIGYNMIIMYAALRAIPEELYDAAAVDGAGPWRTAWSVKIPAIRPAIMLTVIFSVIGTFQLFNEPQLLDRISPIAITNSYTPNLYAYNLAFVNQDVNYAATVAFVLGLVTMVIAYIVQLSTNRKDRA
jgi:multiple sugar transport system permease protein